MDHGPSPMVPGRFQHILGELGVEYQRMHALNIELAKQNERLNKYLIDAEQDSANGVTVILSTVGSSRPQLTSHPTLKAEALDDDNSIRAPTEDEDDKGNEDNNANDTTGEIRFTGGGDSSKVNSGGGSRVALSSGSHSGGPSGSHSGGPSGSNFGRAAGLSLDAITTEIDHQGDTSEFVAASGHASGHFQPFLGPWLQASPLQPHNAQGHVSGRSVEHDETSHGVRTRAPSMGGSSASGHVDDESQMPARLRRGSISNEQIKRHLQLADVWQEQEKTGWAKRRQNSTASLKSKNSKNAGFLSTAEIRAGDAVKSTGCISHFMIAPSSAVRLLWDVITVLVLAWDAVTIPFQAFEPDYEELRDTMTLASTIVWSLDIAISLISGYHADGAVELRPRQVALHYLKTWLCLDILLVSLDWFTVATDDGDFSSFGVLRVTKSFRLFRALRFLRLLRILKVFGTHDFIVVHYPTSEGAQMVITILKFILCLLIVNHFMACIWYAVGTAGSPDSTDSWIKEFERRHGEDASLLFRYTTSVHWSLTQFTPASMEVVPRNSVERLVCIITIILTLASFSSLLSSITNSMMHLRKASSEIARQRDAVRRYIADKRISLDLGNRIFGFLRQRRFGAAVTKRKLHEDDIDAFKVLSDTLREELHGEIFMRILVAHPFFHHFHESDGFIAVKVCHRAVFERQVMPSEEIFVYGQRAVAMYFQISGVSSYYYGLDEMVIPVQEGAWLSEMALWMKWDHRGKYVSMSNLELVELQAAEMTAVVGKHAISYYCRCYALAYLTKVEAASASRVVPDIWGEFDYLQELAHDAIDEYGQELCRDGPSAEPPRTMMSSLKEMRSGGSAGRLQWLVKQPMKFLRRVGS